MSDHHDGSIPNNKSDLKTFGVYSRRPAAGDHRFLHLYWTRVTEPSGTTLMDFEFNQSSSMCAPGEQGAHGRDLLIEYSLVQGGARAVITVRKWNGSAWGAAAPRLLSANEATGTTNTTQILAANTGGVSAVNLNARTFGEASIDLDASSTTRSAPRSARHAQEPVSDSFTSQLKDFIARCRST